MSLLPVYTYGMSVLRKKAKKVTEVDDRLRGLAQNMLDTMHNANGIGLAANQVGVLERVIVIDISEMEEVKDQPEGTPGKLPLVLVNPEIVDENGEWIMEEGCLSIPDVRDEVTRPEAITVQFRDLDWSLHELKANELLGRVILHEIDHLNGVLFIDHLPKIKQKLLRGRLNKIRKGDCEVMYPVVCELAEEKQT